MHEARKICLHISKTLKLELILNSLIKFRYNAPYIRMAHIAHLFLSAIFKFFIFHKVHLFHYHQIFLVHIFKNFVFLLIAVSYTNVKSFINLLWKTKQFTILWYDIITISICTFVEYFVIFFTHCRNLS